MPARATRREFSFSTRRLALVVIAVTASALATSCGVAVEVSATRSDGVATVESTGPATDAPATDTPATDTPATVGSVPPGASIVDFGADKARRSYDAFIDAAFADITQYWSDTYPALYGGTFEPVSGVYAMYDGRTDLPKGCDGPISYADVAENAFYTTCGDLIVYDDDQLLPQLVADLGDAAVGVVAAHEYAHAIQERSGVLSQSLPTVEMEQQADCFAGAWAAHVARGESDLISFDDNDVKAGLIAMIEVRDPPGLDVASAPDGHGSAFDRVGAFQEGFLKGATRCADFVNNPNPRIDLVFLDQADALSGGNLGYIEMQAALPTTLAAYWEPALRDSGVSFTSPTLVPFTDTQVPACDDYAPADLQNTATFCPSTNTVVYDESFTKGLYRRLGDLALAYPIAVAYSDAVQTALGSPLEGKQRSLLGDCLVGVWIKDIVPTVQPDGTITATNPNQEILLSAGDLDEAVQTALVLGDESTTTGVGGTAFEKIDAFRAGVLGGLPACQARLG